MAGGGRKRSIKSFNMRRFDRSGLKMGEIWMNRRNLHHLRVSYYGVSCQMAAIKFKNLQSWKCSIVVNAT